MRSIDSDILDRLETEEFRPFIMWDFHIDSVHYRYTNCDISLMLDGNKYSPRGFEVESINYSSGRIVDSVQVKLDNLDSALTSVFVEGTPQGSDVVLSLVILDSDGSLVGGTSATLFEGYLDSWELNEESVSITIASLFTQWGQRTMRRHSASCRWKVFKGTECGYAGGAVECDRSYARCSALGNSDNFGGFRWLPSIMNAEIWWGRIQG